MASSVGVLLPLISLLMLTTPTEYSTVPSIECQRKIKGCGEFDTPKHDVGTYVCTFNNKTCEFVCNMKCPRQSNEIWMTVSNKRLAKETYFCQAKSWKRRDTPRAYCIAKMPVKDVKQNFVHIAEVNNLVNALFNTSYVYLAMASFYERADVALPGFSKLMIELWEADVKYAREFMSYIHKRGGYISLTDIARPLSHEMLLLNLYSRPGLAGLKTALAVTQDLNDHALDLHRAVAKVKRYADPHLKFYLEDGLISYKTDTIKKLADLIRQLKAFADEDYDIGEYILDLEIGKSQADSVA